MELLSDALIFVEKLPIFLQKVLKFSDVRELELDKTDLETSFLNLEHRSFENVSFFQ